MAKTAWFVALGVAGLLAACGGSGDDDGGGADASGVDSGGGGADGAGGGDGPTVDGAGPSIDASVAVALEGLRWELPCGTDTSATVCEAAAFPTVTATMGGDAATTYQVALRFRGVVEQKTYEGGTAYDYFYVGGLPPTDGYNVYQMHVTNPEGDYYLNAGTSGIERSWLIDYEQTIPINGGATVTLTADAQDGAEIKNVDGDGAPIVVPEIAPAPAAYNGQFVQMDVVGISTL